MWLVNEWCNVMNMASLGFVASVRKSCYTCCCCSVVTAAFPEFVFPTSLQTFPIGLAWGKYWFKPGSEIHVLATHKGVAESAAVSSKLRVLSQAQLEWTTPAVCVICNLTWHDIVHMTKFPAGHLNWIVDLEWLWNVPFSGVNGNWFAHVSLRDGRYRIKFYNSLPIPQLGYSANSSNCREFVKRNVLYK